jgi:hypothetical protein
VTYQVQQQSAASDASFVDEAIRNETADIRVVTDRAEWDALIAASPMPHLPQSFAYGDGKAASGWSVVRVAFFFAGRPIAFATVLQLRRLGLTLLNRVNRGPVFVDAHPARERVVAVYRALRRRFGTLLRGPLTIAAALPMSADSDAILRNAGYRLRHRRSWRSGRIDLLQSEDQLWAGLASTFRNRVRRAEKAGAELRIADDAESFEWMIARHLENMTEKGFSAVGPALLRGLRASNSNDVLIFQHLHEGRPVAGMSVVRFGRVAEYHIGWFGPEGRALNAGNFLMWKVMTEMKRRGVASFDVGGLKPGDGYTRFKQTMHPVEYDLAGEWWIF